MRYWWVNHKQTFDQETKGGYLWSPKRSAGGKVNRFYENMREVSPGDLVFSYANTEIGFIGFIRRHCYECPKPTEFGSTGMNWELIGWRVDVTFTPVNRPLRPKLAWSSINHLFPVKYSPLNQEGGGNQGTYLAEISAELGATLLGLIGISAETLARFTLNNSLYDNPSSAVPQVTQWEDHIEQELASTGVVNDTVRTALIEARRGQGAFRRNVFLLERSCRITGVQKPEHLVASHCKPWRDSTNDERLSGENGLLLTPSIDHLFDRGFISFESDGHLLISPVADRPSLQKMGVPVETRTNVGNFAAGQKSFLEYHQREVFLRIPG